MPTSRVKPMTLPFFDVKVVAGFPIPLNNDELAQDIEVLKMLCPHPDSSYLIRVQGRSMIEAGVNDGDIIIVDKSGTEPYGKADCGLRTEWRVHAETGLQEGRNPLAGSGQSRVPRD